MSDQSPCCAPAGTTTAPDKDDTFARSALAVPAAPEAVRSALRNRLVALDGGTFVMGTRRSTFPHDLDSPPRNVRVSPFRIAPFAVTNTEYAAFVAATGYRTVAEQIGWSFVFHLFLDRLDLWPDHPPGLPWWRRVDGACWKHPEGPGSDWTTRAEHPVVHVAWHDAMAYCNWAGLRLPREAEWEFAARGGLECCAFPWGHELMPEGRHMMNTWQGDFPVRNTAADGFSGTAPVDAFAPNGFGLWNTTGNVWEWVADAAGPSPPSRGSALVDPTGPDDSQARVQRGGSYLCHVSYCDRYHVHSRTWNDADSSTGHAGFRVAADG